MLGSVRPSARLTPPRMDGVAEISSSLPMGSSRGAARASSALSTPSSGQADDSRGSGGRSAPLETRFRGQQGQPECPAFARWPPFTVLLRCNGCFCPPKLSRCSKADSKLTNSRHRSWAAAPALRGAVRRRSIVSRRCRRYRPRQCAFRNDHRPSLSSRAPLPAFPGSTHWCSSRKVRRAMLKITFTVGVDWDISSANWLWIRLNCMIYCTLRPPTAGLELAIAPRRMRNWKKSPLPCGRTRMCWQSGMRFTRGQSSGSTALRLPM